MRMRTGTKESPTNEWRRRRRSLCLKEEGAHNPRVVEDKGNGSEEKKGIGKLGVVGGGGAWGAAGACAGSWS